MTFRKRALLMLATYCVALTVIFGPIVGEILAAESLLGRLPVHANLSPEQRIDYVRKTVLGTVKVNLHAYDERRGMGEGYGTGSVFTEDGYILTAAHVVQDKEYVYATLHQLDDTATGFDELRVEPADVLAVSPEHDMAIIKLRHPERVRLTVLAVDPETRMKKGSSFWLIGSTTGVRPGIVTKVDSTERLMDASGRPPTVIRGAVVARTEADHGDSGGPTLSSDGRIVGIIIGSDGGMTGVISPLRGAFPDLLAKAQARAAQLKTKTP